MRYELSESMYIHIIRKIIGLENALSEKDFKVMTWNHDIKTLFHLKQFEQGIDTSPPDYPQSHISEIEQEQWHKGFFTLWGIGAAISCLSKKKFMEWLVKEWSDEPTKGHVDGLTDRLT